MSFQAKIRRSIVRAVDDKEFLPNDAIETLTSPEEVRPYLEGNRQRLQGVAVGSLVAYVTNPTSPAKRLFLTLVFCGCLDYLVLLRQAGFYDIDLPIEKEYDDTNYRYDVYTKNTRQSQESRRKLWKVFHQWADSSQVESFYSKQWCFMAPIFVSNVFDYQLSPNCPLPIIYKSSASQKTGLSGVVLSVKIHEAHIREEYRGKRVASKVMHPDNEDYYAQEARALRIICDLGHPRLIEPLAAYTRGEQAGFFFPWAGGGNLEEYWQKHAPPVGGAGIRWVLDQLYGLCDATEALHQENCRHTDLKPQNILLFHEGKSPGTLRIADVGLAKIHTDQTEQRQTLDIITSARTGSTRYQAPELQPPVEQLSRVFDVWCLGCVFLEFLVWTVYGQGGLASFWQNSTHFWEGTRENYRQHRKVKEQISMMWTTLSSRGTKNALLDCLELVAKRMLEPDYRYRMDATETRLELQRIRDRGSRDNSYLAVPPELEVAHTRSPGIDSMNTEQLEVFWASMREQEYNVSEAMKLDDHWVARIDNRFARSLFNVNRSETPPALTPWSDLCPTCCHVGDINFILCSKMENIAKRSKACALCEMLYQSAKEAGLSDSDTLKCRRVESTIMIEPHGATLLSIFADPKNPEFWVDHTQIGHAQLSQPLSDFQMTLFKEWLRVCDEEHNHRFKLEVELPTRVLDVGTNEQPKLCLHEEQKPMLGQYVALSHCWGTAQSFSTLRSNVVKFRQYIAFEDLPKTFKDAIEITRKLEFRYLWIDSLCIVQDDPMDWEREAASMEHVFSSASVTIAASSARSSLEGFLPTRKEQQSFITIKTPSGGTVFIRKSIDNFRRDVEESVLNQRGWVLQERALARRTIHFTSSQVYWECGSGIHCESMMKLVNRKAAFLGDSDFPNSALAYFKGARILLFQSLYKTYSTLGFSHATDRSIAIRGLEERLLKAFGTKGGFGVFERYLHRSLLWKRREGSALIPVAHDTNGHVPSWSWMSCSGPISFLEAPFDGVDWRNNITALFSSRSGRKQHWKTGQSDSFAYALRGKMRKLRVTATKLEERAIFDQTDEEVDVDLRCIVLGEEKMASSTGSAYSYVLFIKPVSSGQGANYNRVGVGRLLSDDISEDEGVEVFVL